MKGERRRGRRRSGRRRRRRIRRARFFKKERKTFFFCYSMKAFTKEINKHPVTQGSYGGVVWCVVCGEVKKTEKKKKKKKRKDLKNL